MGSEGLMQDVRMIVADKGHGAVTVCARCRREQKGEIVEREDDRGDWSPPTTSRVRNRPVARRHREDLLALKTDSRVHCSVYVARCLSRRKRWQEQLSCFAAGASLSRASH